MDPRPAPAPPTRTPEQIRRAKLVRHFDQLIGPGEVFTVLQMSQLFSCSVLQVLELIRNQKLIAFSIGGGTKKHWRVQRPVLLRYMADNSNFTEEMLDQQDPG